MRSGRLGRRRSRTHRRVERTAHRYPGRSPPASSLASCSVLDRPELEERLGRQFGQRQERPVRKEHPFAHQRVDVRVRMDDLAERLEGVDHARHGVGPTAGGAVHRDHRAGGRPAQFAQPPAVEQEVAPQPLGDREHKLPVGNLSANVFGDPTSLLQRSLVVA